ncbi:hypothetical protein SAMN05192542_111168 [Paraburkholderia caballeronis]|uniref:Uncharacterized protein n=1 Tax=Paraburkholderia caballeronis TaxID=416943 RepID=A0A1H7SAD1_9BURK|nr:hypothetical protein C7403_112168 [Paraburkholderia caballeronis]PXW97352.1 hypothetical protein C7407_112168 [Paraburkholderia caballeronis]RAJ93872.1 hypothetical protein C7409_112168 [Paraburkholderia caballeronis]SEL69176.1 hypothetical protein SAMN05192542_111168 [Paraburkholderia caballeronis]
MRTGTAIRSTAPRCALYATDDAEYALKRLRPRDFETPVGITKEIGFGFRPARAALAANEPAIKIHG